MTVPPSDGQREGLDRLLVAVLQRPDDAGHALSADIARDQSQRLLANLVGGDDVAVPHRQKTEAGLGYVDAFDQVGKLVECDVDRDHAGDVGSVFGSRAGGRN